MDELAIDVRGLRKSFGGTRALREVSLMVRRGEMVALLGPPGAGKSTLLRQLGGQQRADHGSESTVVVLGRTLQDGGLLARSARETRRQMATIAAPPHHSARLPVMREVLAGALHRLPAWRVWLRRFPGHERQRALDALARVGLAHCAGQRRPALADAQQRRVAIARALVQGVQLMLADDPVASLAPAAGRELMALLAALNHELGLTVLVSLRQLDPAVAICPRTIALRDGEVVYDGATEALTPARLRLLYGMRTEALPPADAGPGRPRGVPALRTA